MVSVRSQHIHFIELTKLFLMILSDANAGLSFWSFGVMHNYASDASKSKAEILRENMRLEGRLDEQAEERLNKLARRINPSAAPNCATSINMVSFVIAVGLIITFFIMK